MALKLLFLQTTFFLLLFFTSCNNTLACFSITDDNNFVNPVLSANFNLLPDINPFTDCWLSSIKIRSDRNNWRLIANRSGPLPSFSSSNPSELIKPSDLSILYKLQSFGNASNDGAFLVSPFASITDLSSIQSGTLIVSGNKRSGNSCSPYNSNFYKLINKICIYRDFVFDVGEYNGQISYLLVSP